MSDQKLAKRQVWDFYARAWGTPKLSERLRLFEQSLDARCIYTAPNARAQGWDELDSEMARFQADVPGGSFAVTYFLSHHDYCFTRWDLLNAEGVCQASGQSVGEFNAQGKLVKMTGFFELPG